MKISEILKLLHEDGWAIVTIRGRHRQLKQPMKPGCMSEPGKPSDELRRTMNWQTVFQSVQSIAKGSRDAPCAIIALRHEVVATTQLTVAEKEEMQLALDGLQGANLYGKIALVGQLKEVLSTHAEWKAQFAEYGIRRGLS